MTFEAGANRRRLVLESNPIGVRFFLGLPNEILIHEICSFLSRRCIYTLLGKTCWAIRQEYYKATSVYTSDRPMHVAINVETGYVAPDEDYGAYLIRQARARSEVVPIHATLRPNRPVSRAGWHLSDFKYTICRFAASDISLRALVHFLSQHPEFGSVSVLDFREIDTSEAPQDPHMALDLATQIAFPAVRLVTLDQDGIAGHQALSLRFPQAVLRINLLNLLEIDDRLIQTMRARGCRDNVQISGLCIACDYYEGWGELEQYRWCIQRTVSVFILSNDIPSEVADLLASELKSLSAIPVYYIVRTRRDLTDAALPLVCPAYAKYVTSVTLGHYNESDDLMDYYLKIMHGFVSVRRLEVCFALGGPIRLSLASPDNVIVIHAEKEKDPTPSISIEIKSPTPLRLADMEYIVVSIDGMTQIQYTDAVECDIAQQVAAIRQRLPQTHDPAWRLMYKFHSSDDPNAVPIEGYV